MSGVNKPQLILVQGPKDLNATIRNLDSIINGSSKTIKLILSDEVQCHEMTQKICSHMKSRHKHVKVVNPKVQNLGPQAFVQKIGDHLEAHYIIAASHHPDNSGVKKDVERYTASHTVRVLH